MKYQVTNTVQDLTRPVVIGLQVVKHYIRPWGSSKRAVAVNCILNYEDNPLIWIKI